MRVDEAITVRARPSAVWDVIADPRDYTDVMAGVTRWDAVRSGPTGVGARYAMRMRAGSADVGGEVEIVEYSPCADLAWTAVTGIEQRGRWRIREVEPGISEVHLRIAYQSPGGLMGLVVDQVSGREVRANVRRTLDNLRARVESAPAETTSTGPASLLAQRVRLLSVLASSGVLRPIRPDRALGAALELHRWGLTLPGGYAAAAATDPAGVAIVDDSGALSFADVDRRSTDIAAGLAASGIAAGDRVGILARNHRGLVLSLASLAKAGADAVLLNTSFAAPQVAAVIRGEGIAAVIHDREFGTAVEGALPAGRRYLCDGDGSRSRRTLDALARRGRGHDVQPPERDARVTILTSGTTGTPKGAMRSQPRTADPAVALLSRIPLRAREATLVAAPLFHAWGFAHLGLGVMLSSTLVLRRSFDPEQVLADIEKHGVTAMAAVPVMLERILELPRTRRRRYDLTSLRVVAVSGSALPGDLATRFMDEFGDVLYNLYGSTEVAWATIATPDDLRAAPQTAGRPPAGTTVRILDDAGGEVAPGTTGRVFVANRMLFEGYTGGGGKESVDGMLSTGDRGRFDESGLLFVEGREDDMIVSGGENVFPEEVEECLLEHPGVAEVAVRGVEDSRWGQRVVAFVVPAPRKRPDPKLLQEHVRRRLARYKVPREVVFLEALPRTSTGKVARRELDPGAAHDSNGVSPRRTPEPARPRRGARRSGGLRESDGSTRAAPRAARAGGRGRTRAPRAAPREEPT